MSKVSFNPLINKITTLLSNISSLGLKDQKSIYPDLDENEMKLVNEYFFYRLKKNRCPEKYLEVKNKLFLKIKYTYAEFMDTPRGSHKRAELLGKLINYSWIIKDYEKVSDLKKYIGERKPDITTEGADPFPFESLNRAKELCFPNLPKEITCLLLNAKSGDNNFYDYSKKQVNNIFIFKDLGSNFKSMKRNDIVGLHEGFSKSIVLDIYDEEAGAYYADWEIASALVHEAAHIDWYNRQEDNPKLQNALHSERAACLVEYSFLHKITKNAINGREERSKIEKMTKVFISLEKRINELNKQLGYKEQNFNLIPK